MQRLPSRAFAAAAAVVTTAALSVALFDTALADPVGDANAGLAALNRGDNAEAVRLLTKALNSGALSHSDRELADLKRAEAFAGESNTAAARDDLNEAAKLDPNDAEAVALRRRLENVGGGPPAEAAAPPTVHIPTSFDWTYQFPTSGDDGARHWVNVAPGQWLEESDSGGPGNPFSVLGPGSALGCDGILLENAHGDLQAFVPNDQCPNQSALFRHMQDGRLLSDTWYLLGKMFNVTY